MPGKRFDLRITKGPLKGRRCRYLKASKNLPAAAAVVELKDMTDAVNEPLITEMPLEWLQRIPASKRSTATGLPKATPAETRPHEN